MVGHPAQGRHPRLVTASRSSQALGRMTGKPGRATHHWFVPTVRPTMTRVALRRGRAQDLP